jgi:hypothetical protein
MVRDAMQNDLTPVKQELDALVKIIVKTVPVEQIYLASRLRKNTSKSFLFKNDIVPSEIHDLMKLLNAREMHLTEFSSLIKHCVFLNRFSVSPRYPDEFPITSDDVKTALWYANEVKDFVVRRGLCS